MACKVCTSTDREGIEAALADGVGQTEVAERFSISRFSIVRHVRKGHADRAKASRDAVGLDPVTLFRQAYDFEPLEWQVGFLLETRNSIAKTGRQVGKSTATALLAIHSALNVPQSLSAIVSPSLKQSSEITTRARHGFDNLGIRLVQDSASLLRLENGSRIMSLPGTPRSVRGWSADFLAIDEGAFLADETFIAARALVATGGRLVVTSTPAAPFGEFFGLWSSGDPDWARFEVKSTEVPTISAGFLAQERRTMGEQAYRREYLGEFGEPPGGLFSVEKLESLVRPSVALPWVRAIQQEAEGS